MDYNGQSNRILKNGSEEEIAIQKKVL